MIVTPDSSDPPRPLEASRWILLVEDELVLRRLLERALARQGYRVVACGTGREALAVLQSAPTGPALLIADVLLPDTEGTYVVDAVRQRTPPVPVILISGLGMSELEGFAVEADRFLEKPFDLSELLDHVRELAGDPTS